MDFEAIVGKVGIYAASFVVGFVSGLVPFINSELYLLFVSTIAARSALLPIAALSAAGQMVAKSLLFYAGRGTIKIPIGRYESKADAVRAKFERWEKRSDLLILLSATVGFPPFYVVSVVAGALKLGFPGFLIAGLFGRTVRFALVVYFPQLVMRFA